MSAIQIATIQITISVKHLTDLESYKKNKHILLERRYILGSCEVILAFKKLPIAAMSESRTKYCYKASI